ncbi:MAG TPA: hypothetical protein VIN00_10340 [Candidatus Dormibacteraeota bacterium]
MKLSLGLAVLLVALACGGSSAAHPPPKQPTAAVAAWQGFLADQVPRPIVLFWDLLPAGGGFASNDAKIAGMCNKFAPGAALPSGVPGQAVATWADGVSANYPAISAAAAVAARSHPPPGVRSQDCTAVPALVLTHPRFTTSQFKTDRGTATLSAWLFTSSVVTGDIAFPALTLSAYWADGMSTPAPETATVGTDGRAVKFKFWGAPSTSGPCGADYKGVVAESASAAAIALWTMPHASSGGSGACSAIAEQRTVTVTLVSQLGGRVLANSTGAAVLVCRESAGTAC